MGNNISCSLLGTSERYLFFPVLFLYIVIDYLQLMTSGQRSENRVQEISIVRTPFRRKIQTYVYYFIHSFLPVQGGNR